MTDFDIEDQQEPEQFTAEELDDKPSKEVYKQLKEQKKREKFYASKNKKEEVKHKARFTRVDNLNSYICDHCGKTYPEEKGSLIYKASGEYAYCVECLKELYPNYKPIKLAGLQKKTEYLSNNFETLYNKGF